MATRRQPRGDATFAPSAAFVVQFRSGSDPAREPIDGRVEHVVSGRSTRFSSRRQLLDFMSRTLREEPSGASRSGS